MISPKNRVLQMLPPGDWAEMSSLFVSESLKLGQVLHEPFQQIKYVYFFEGGLSSEIALNAEVERIEIGCAGREGFSGMPVVLGVTSTPHKSFMEIGGVALRISANDLRFAMDAYPKFRALLLRYIHVFMIQIAATTLADGRYDVNQRLARWLLMCHDRVERDELTLTHEFLALMLGVRRSSVTDALHILEGEHVIKASRGLIVVRDRAGLETIAGHAYGLPEAEYERVMIAPV